jgi:transcriptional/translational regulatory protein YebC/TACO1
VPLNTLDLSSDGKENMIKFLEQLDEDDDVQNIFTNSKMIY